MTPDEPLQRDYAVWIRELPIQPEAYDGSACPVCTSPNFFPTGQQEVDDMGLLRTVRCACGAQWDEVYRLEGYMNLEIRRPATGKRDPDDAREA